MAPIEVSINMDQSDLRTMFLKRPHHGYWDSMITTQCDYGCVCANDFPGRLFRATIMRFVICHIRSYVATIDDSNVPAVK
jgi:hypothetical protein